MNTIRKHFLLSSLFFFSVSLMAAECETIEALLLIDSKSTLSEAVDHDKKSMMTTLEKIASCTDMSLKTTVYEGRNVSRKNILKWLQSLQKGPHDVVLFYFSGHGCKEKTHIVPWPRLFFSAEGSFFSMNTVIQSIEGVQSRLSIILSDCCNGALATKSYSPNLLPKASILFKEPTSTLGAHVLFKKAQGHIRVTAASPGQNALAYTHGSIFTLALKKALTQAITQKKTSWDRVFESTKGACGTLQTPYISLDLK